MTKQFIRRIMYLSLICLTTITGCQYDMPAMVYNRMIVDTEPSIPVITSIKSKLSIEDFAGFEIVDVCHTSSSKTYMLATSLSETSQQAQFIKNNMIAIDGLFYDKDGYVGVALGSYFGEIGTRYIFTLDTGIKLKVIKVEHKDDKHTNNGCEQKWDKSVIEFVVDSKTNNVWVGQNTFIANGNFNNLDRFNGAIAQIKKVVNFDINLFKMELPWPKTK